MSLWDARVAREASYESRIEAAFDQAEAQGPSPETTSRGSGGPGRGGPVRRAPRCIYPSSASAGSAISLRWRSSHAADERRIRSRLARRRGRTRARPSGNRRERPGAPAVGAGATSRSTCRSSSPTPCVTEARRPTGPSRSSFGGKPTEFAWRKWTQGPTSNRRRRLRAVTPPAARGLFLVDQIAERWGVSPAPAGTCVWFELPAGVTA